MAAPPLPSRRPRLPIAPPFLEYARRAGRAFGTPIGSILFAVVVGAIVVLVTGGNPIAAYLDLLCGGFGMLCGSNSAPAAFQISENIVFTIPLILTGLSVAIAFRAGLFNIGAEGQLILGSIAATAVGVRLASAPGFILLPLVLIAGTLAGAIWGGIVGVLKAITGAHEVVTTIMLNYVAQYLILFLIIGGPLQLPGHPASSPTIGRGATLPALIPVNATLLGLPGSVYRAHSGILIALAAAGIFSFLLKRTTLGYELRAVGQSHRAARYAGISVGRTLIVTMLIAGAFAGLAGAVQIAGLQHGLTDSYQADTTGFDAIAVALLGQGGAIGIVLAAILFAGLHVGGQFMQGDAGVSANLVQVLQALILFSIAANFIRNLRIRLPALRKRPPGDAEPGMAAVAPDLEPAASNPKLGTNANAGQTTSAME